LFVSFVGDSAPPFVLSLLRRGIYNPSKEAHISKVFLGSAYSAGRIIRCKERGGRRLPPPAATRFSIVRQVLSRAYYDLHGGEIGEELQFSTRVLTPGFAEDQWADQNTIFILPCCDEGGKITLSFTPCELL
jgi:hypothetical protein